MKTNRKQFTTLAIAALAMGLGSAVAVGDQVSVVLLDAVM